MYRGVAYGFYWYFLPALLLLPYCLLLVLIFANAEFVQKFFRGPGGHSGVRGALPLLRFTAILAGCLVFAQFVGFYGVVAALDPLAVVPDILEALAGAVTVVSSPMHALLSLITVFLSAVLLYAVSGAEYLALVLLIVYIGAVAILFLFVVMLLPITDTEDSSKIRAGFFILALLLTFAAINTSDLPHLMRSTPLADKLVYYVTLGAADIMSFAGLYGVQSAPFFIITVILLATVIGAIVLATGTLEERASASVTSAGVVPLAEAHHEEFLTSIGPTILDGGEVSFSARLFS
jgi:NADH-quinone oxidoreductase subunit J